MKKTGLILIIILIISLYFISCLGKNRDSNQTGKAQTHEIALSDKEASWEDQMVYMGYLLYRISNINVINGINLDVGQIEKLRAIASDIERVVPPFALKGALSPDLAKVAKTYLELKEILLDDQFVSDELKKRVFQARELEAKVIRDGLTYDTSRSYGDCLRCHASPDISKGFNLSKKHFVDINEAKRRNPSIIKEQAYAHFKACLGNKGIFLLWKKSRDIDNILTENQKVMLKDFSCCLIPPQGMSDPMRIGQAPVLQAEVKLLEEVRKLPEDTWNRKKDLLIKRLEYFQFVITPDVSKSKLREFHKQAERVLEKARSLSDEDFELKKEELVAEIKQMKKQELSERLRLLQQAFLLVMPGSKEVYDSLKARYDKESK